MANSVEKPENLLVEVRRQWNDSHFADYRLSDISDLRWDRVSGGVRVPTPQPFVFGYVWCDAMVSGDLAHSCEHGEGPHRIKVCITKSGNEKIWQNILAVVGPRSRR